MSQEYPVGSNVWAKLKGYPWWPARIEEEKTLPQIVLDKKPSRPNPIWPVFFYGSEDYGWFGRDCLKDFNTHLHELSTNTKKGALFCKALKQATQPSKLGASINGSEEESESESKTVSRSSRKNKAKSSAKQEPRKKPNTKSTAVKNKKLPSEPENVQDTHESEEVNPPNNTQSEPDSETLLKNMIYLRHNLQRAALKDKMKDNESVEQYLDEVEKFPVTPNIIQESKIGKLLRHLVRHVPENEHQEKIIDRSHKLIKKFKEIIHEVNPEGSSHGDNSHINGSEAKEDDKPSKDQLKEPLDQANKDESKPQENHTENNGTINKAPKSPHSSEDPSSPNDQDAKPTEVTQTTDSGEVLLESDPKPEPEPEPELELEPELEPELETKGSSLLSLNGTLETSEINQESEDNKLSLKHQAEEDPTEEDSHSLSPSKRPKAEDASETILSPKESEIKSNVDAKIDSIPAETNNSEELKDHNTVENSAPEDIPNSISQQPKEETPQTVTSA